MNLETRPDVSCHCDSLQCRRLVERLCLHSHAQPRRLSAGRDRRGRSRSEIRHIWNQIVHQLLMPNKGDEFHHFGWNACSSSLSPLSGHAFLERRYLIVPGIRSSRIYIIDVKEPSGREDPQDHRTRRGVCQDRLFASPYHPLRTRGHLCLDPGRRRPGRHRRSTRHLHHGLPDL